MTNNISIDYDEYMYIEIFINTLQSSDISYQYSVCRGRIPSMTFFSASGRCFSFGDDRRIQLGLGDTRTAGASGCFEDLMIPQILLNICQRDLKT